MTTTDTPTIDNGVNVEALRGAREALTNHPEAASFQWRASCEWVRGTHSRTTITDFSGLGAEHAHRQAYTVDADHPEVFASEDNGPTPPEIALAALASCLTAGVATVASNRGVQLHSVKATVTAGMDLQGILGIDGDVRNGFDRCDRDLRHRRRRESGGPRGDPRPVPEAFGRLRHHHQPDHRPGLPRLSGLRTGSRALSATTMRATRVTVVVVGAGQAGLAMSRHLCRCRARPRRARTRRGGVVVAHRALGLAQAAHPELDVPPAGVPVRGAGPRRLPDGGGDRRLARGLRLPHRRPGPHPGHGAAGAADGGWLRGRDRRRLLPGCGRRRRGGGVERPAEFPTVAAELPRRISQVTAMALPEPCTTRRHGRCARCRCVGLGHPDRGRAPAIRAIASLLPSVSTSGSRAPTEAATSTGGWRRSASSTSATTRSKTSSGRAATPRCNSSATRRRTPLDLNAALRTPASTSSAGSWRCPARWRSAPAGSRA